MKRVALVTGGAGFIGSAASRELRRRGWRVVQTDRSDGDLCDPRAAARIVARARPSAIVHAAGRPKETDPARLWAAHVSTTINVLEAAERLAEPPRVVIAGSAAELTPSAYGAAKRAQTLAALSFRHDGLPVAVARIFNSCGPSAPATLVPGGFIAQLAAIERGGKHGVLEVGNLSAARDFVDVRDIAAALADLCEPGAPTGVYDVCSGQPRTIRSVLDALLALARVPVTVRQRRGAAPGARVSVGDPSRLRRATGWRPRISFAASLGEALALARRRR